MHKTLRSRRHSQSLVYFNTLRYATISLFSCLIIKFNKHMKKILLFLAYMPLLFTTSCNNDDDAIVCTLEAKAGLNITVKDASTNAVLSDGVTVTAQDGTYTETLEQLPNNEIPVFIGAWERAGTYVITISKEGYQTFTSEPIVVTADVCHVIPQVLTLNLQPN